MKFATVAAALAAAAFATPASAGTLGTCYYSPIYKACVYCNAITKTCAPLNAITK